MAETVDEMQAVTNAGPEETASDTVRTLALVIDGLIIAALIWFCVVAIQTPPREGLPQVVALFSRGFLPTPLGGALGAVALALLITALVGRLAPAARGLLSAAAVALLLSLTLDYGPDLWAASDYFDPRVEVSLPIMVIGGLVLLRILVTIKEDSSPTVGAALGAPVLLIVLTWFSLYYLSPCLLPMRRVWTEFYPVVLALIWTTVHYGVLLLGTTVAAQEPIPSRVLAVLMALALIAKAVMMKG